MPPTKLVIHNSGRSWGGNEKWLATLADGLQARGHAVVVACGEGAVADELRRRGIRTATVGPGGPLDVLRGLRFLRWLRSERPDAVLLTSWRGTAWGAWAARRAGASRVVVRLGLVRRALPWRHAIAFRQWVDAMIVNAPEIRDAWRVAAPWFPPMSVHVVLNAVPNAILPPDARAVVRTELAAGPAMVVVTGVGSLEARKGFDLLLDAFGATALGDALLVIAGRGPDELPLRARAEALGIDARVRWLGFRGDLPSVLAASDLFVLASRNEGMANVMLEAMALRVPVVATDISGVRTALGAGDGGTEAGWIVPPDDAAALGTMLQSVVTALRETPALVAERTTIAFQRAQERFGVERMVDECERVLFAADPRAGRTQRNAEK